jgi:hypothetical protein
MKKFSIIISFVALALLLFSTNSAMAQVKVTKGSTHTYSVTPIPNTATYVYNWSVTGGTTSTFGTAATTNNVLWDGAVGTYTLTVFPKDATSGCLGDDQTLSVEIVGMSTIGWTVTTSNACPKNTKQTGDFTITANITGAALDGDYKFTYSIDGGASSAPVTLTVASGAGTKDVTIPGIANTGVGPETHTIKFTNLTSPDGLSVAYTGAETNATHTVTVERIGTTGIIQN